MELFPMLLALCEGNSPATGEFSPQRPVTRRFDFFFDLRLNKRMSTLSRRRWFETLSRSLWRHCNDLIRENPPQTQAETNRRWVHSGNILHLNDLARLGAWATIAGTVQCQNYVNLGCMQSNWRWYVHLTTPHSHGSCRQHSVALLAHSNLLKQIKNEK